MSCFFDTNVLVYAVDPSHPAKQAVALALMQQAIVAQQFVISTQVLGEFYNVTTRGTRPLLEAAQARAQVQALARQRVLPTTPRLVLDATALQQQQHLAWWDAMVLQAALSCGAEILYSEDFQHGRRLDALQIVNPFISP